jgi:hypothetical protein
VLGWVPRIERKIAQAFMGGRRWERGTTAAPRLCCAAVSVRAATVAGKGETPPPLGFMLLVRLHSAASSSAPARPHDSQARRRNRHQFTDYSRPRRSRRASRLRIGLPMWEESQNRNRNSSLQGNPPAPKNANVGDEGFDSHFLSLIK